MKNLHLLPTDKPSRLIIQNSNRLILGVLDYAIIENRQHIYITSSEKIKEGDSIFETDINTINIAGKDYVENEVDFKIILTTDQDLINDGVQAIPNDFLEWFVKNPSCQFVEVVKGKLQLNDDGQEYGFPDMSKYKIIIPKEEPKQTDWKESTKLLMEAYGHNPKDFPYEELKQETTLEEVAERLATNRHSRSTSAWSLYKNGIIEGAKWQQERMYSEENLYSEIESLIIMWSNDGTKTAGALTRQIMEKFKKK
jgi:hypothetical protein